HFALLGLLNTSAACFWLKQAGFYRGGGGIGGGLATEAGGHFWELPAAALADFSVVPMSAEWAQRLSSDGAHKAGELRTAADGANLDEEWHAAISAQEELDWQAYRAFGLVGSDFVSECEPPRLFLGERAFEIAFARRVAAGEVETVWFERHGS